MGWAPLRSPGFGTRTVSSDHPARLPLERLESECELRFGRRSGPGGQNRNKVETAVELTHRPTGLKAEASERRTQGENRRAALDRLRRTLALDIRRPIEPGAPPSDLWRSRIRSGRIAVNPSHDDFPALLAEALDHLHAAEDDPKRAAATLGCTASQLVKFLQLEPRAFARLNERRAARGLHALH